MRIVSRLMAALHRWSGILITAYVVIVALSGSVLVFHDEIAQQIRVPSLERSTERALSADEIVGRIRQQFPDWQLQTLWWPEDDHSPWFAEVRKGEVGALGETALAVYLHPSSGVVLKTHNYTTSSWRWLQLLHFNLLTGRSGRLTNGVLSLVILVCTLTGVFLWWPASLSRPLLRVNRATGSRRLTWELHQVLGIYLLPFVIVMCVTGSYFAWRASFHSAIAVAFPMRFMNQPVRPIQPPPEATLPIESFLPEIKRLIPSYPVTRVIFPERPDAPIRFIVYEGSRAHFYKASNLFFHPATGALLRSDLVRDRLTGDSIVQWIGAVHYGAFGSWPIKLLWVLSGVLFQVVAITGMVVWLKRGRSRS